MNKKGDISIQVIVVAILALLVLVILSVMFISKVGKTNAQLDACESRGGTCHAKPCAANEQAYVFANSACQARDGSESVCCLPFTDDSSGSGGVSTT